METQEQTQPTVEAKQPAAAARMRPPAKALPLSMVALVLIALILFGVLLVLRGHGADKATLPPVGTAAAVSESQLKTLATQSSQPIYWAGPKSGAYHSKTIRSLRTTRNALVFFAARLSLSAASFSADMP